ARRVGRRGHAGAPADSARAAERSRDGRALGVARAPRSALRLDSADTPPYDRRIPSKGRNHAMAKRAGKRARRTPGDRAPRKRRAPVTRPAPSSVARLVQHTVLTALAGARDVGSGVGSVAVSAVRGSIRAAGEIGVDVGRLALSVAAGALDAADRIT